MTQRRLFAVVADPDAENAIKNLLCERQPSLGISLDFNPDRPLHGDMLRCSGRDCGFCKKKAWEMGGRQTQSA
ncbi:MAG: hypothetical protein ACKO2P_02370 [Planctomycetota bacterium]